MRLIGYIRVSTDDQANSLADQEALVRQYCTLYGHELAGVISDWDISGGVPLCQRPGGELLLKRLTAREADGVVFKELDRLFRSVVDGIETADRFNAKGWHIHAVFDHVDTSTPDGWLSLVIKLAVGEWERRKIGHRTKSSLRGKQARGEAYGPTPYGCVRVGDQLFKDPATWPVRERIVAMRGSDEPVAYSAIAAELRREQVAPPEGGKRWHKSTLMRIVNSHDAIKHYPFVDTVPETGISNLQGDNHE